MVKGILASGCSSSAYPEALAEFKFKLSCSCPGEPQFEKVSFCLNEGNLFSFFPLYHYLRVSWNVKGNYRLN